MNTGAPHHADLPGRVDRDAFDADNGQALDRTAAVFGSKLEAPHPFVIKRTTISKGVRTVEYFTGMHMGSRNWSHKPCWNRHMVNGVGYQTREEARSVITTLGLKPRAEVAQREEVRHETGR
jgi:hypothetical protein